MAIAVDPDQFRLVADQIISIGLGVSEDLDSFLGSVAGTYGMAGSDPQASTWAQSYNTAAAQLTQAITQLSAVLESVGILLHQSGYNHGAAVCMSCPPGTGVLPTPVPSPSLACIGGAVPTAYGGGQSEPNGWWLISDLVGYVWPDGTEGELGQAAGAWRALASSLRTASARVTSAFGDLVSANQAPEISAIATKQAALVSTLNKVATACDNVGKSASDYSNHLSSAHSRIIDELITLVATVGATQVAGWGLAIVTAGISEVASTAADAGIIAATAARVAGIIEDLIGFVEGAISAVEDVVGTIGDVLSGLGDLMDMAPDFADLDQIGDVTMGVGDTVVSDTPDLVGAEVDGADGLSGLDDAPSLAVDDGTDAVTAGDADPASLGDGVDGSPPADPAPSTTPDPADPPSEPPTSGEGGESATWKQPLWQKIAASAAGNATGSAVGQELTTGHVNLGEVAVDATVGGLAGTASGLIAPDAEGVVGIAKNVAIDGVAGSGQEAVDELVQGEGLDPEKIAVSGVVSGVVGGGIDSGTDALMPKDGIPVTLGDDGPVVHLEGGVQVGSGVVGSVAGTGITNAIDPGHHAATAGAGSHGLDDVHGSHGTMGDHDEHDDKGAGSHDGDDSHRK